MHNSQNICKTAVECFKGRRWRSYRCLTSSTIIIIRTFKILNLTVDKRTFIE